MANHGRGPLTATWRVMTELAPYQLSVISTFHINTLTPWSAYTFPQWDSTHCEWV